MKKLISAAIAITAFILTACVPQTNTATPEVTHYTGTKECTLAWEATQIRLSEYLTLSIVSDVLIQGSYRGVNSYETKSVRATRVNKENGSCTITVIAKDGFGNPFLY